MPQVKCKHCTRSILGRHPTVKSCIHNKNELARISATKHRTLCRYLVLLVGYFRHIAALAGRTDTRARRQTWGRGCRGATEPKGSRRLLYLPENLVENSPRYFRPQHTHTLKATSRGAPSSTAHSCPSSSPV